MRCTLIKLLSYSAILVQPNQADSTTGKNVIIGEPRKDEPRVKVVGRQVVLEKDEAGKNKLKITIGSFSHRGPARASTQQRASDEVVGALLKLVQPVLETGQAGFDPLTAANRLS